MDLALAVARSGLQAQHQNLEIISNNLANSNTAGYKKTRGVFEDLPYQMMQPPGSPTSQETNTSSGFVMGTGTRVIDNAKNYSDGSLLETNVDKDFALQGRGFFQVQLPGGSGFAYTRDGHFTLNEQGQLTMQNGYVLQPPITLPQGYSQLTVSTDGIVTVLLPGAQQPSQVGQLQLADFVNEDALQPIGNGLYLETVGSGAATLGNPASNGLAKVYNNMLEGSNVNVVEEMVNLIEAQRAFEVTSKAVSAVDNMMQNLDRIS